jgi:hypothetical protein
MPTTVKLFSSDRVHGRSWSRPHLAPFGHNQGGDMQRLEFVARLELGGLSAPGGLASLLRDDDDDDDVDVLPPLQPVRVVTRATETVDLLVDGASIGRVSVTVSASTDGRSCDWVLDLEPRGEPVPVVVRLDFEGARGESLGVAEACLRSDDGRLRASGALAACAHPDTIAAVRVG